MVQITTTIPGAVTDEEKILKKNDLKARSILMMTLPKYVGNEAQEGLKDSKKLMYETFSASSSESLDSIFNSTNDVNTTNVHVSTSSTPVSTASTNNNTVYLNDATVYAYLATQPNGS
ncbi:hypothetical protein Tco_1036573 [Tanacetum coccineum]